MAKVFRHHKGDNTITDWDHSTAYQTNTIDQIKDPNGGNANHEITSIPSPFARMDLVKTAFKEVSRTGVELSGNTIYHKMVSDALDVGQIFFNFSQFKKELNIISWDKDTDLQTLLDSSNASHKLYGKTLELFLKQDSKAYNFDLLNRIFLLEQPGHGTGRMHVIGGTSPSTLFFASANDLSTSKFSFDADITFDDSLRSLNMRDTEYIKFWFFLRNCIPQFARRFPEVNTYLTKVSSQLEDPSFRAELNELNIDNYNNDLVELSADGHGIPVEVCGFNLRQKNIRSVIDEIPALSDFVIASRKDILKPPLVLPNSVNTEGLRYINEPWPSDLEAPNFDASPLGERILPGLKVPYPYLTVSDLLEPYLIKVPYKINDEKFYSGENKTKDGYLLPLKAEVFDYFDVTEIINGTSGGEFIEFKESASGVLVILRIPVKNGKKITFERKYSEPANSTSLAEVDQTKNIGAVVPIKMSLNVVPFVRPTYVDGIYKISLIDLETSPLIDETVWNINFLLGNERIAEKNTFRYTAISKKEDNRKDELKHFEACKNFDALELQNGPYRALILPLFKKLSAGTTKYKFAVDFGTSNTHIEYTKDDDNISFPFEITKDDTQVVSLYKNLKDKSLNELGNFGIREFQTHINRIILPFEIRKNSLFNFPVRTAIQFNKRFNFDNAQSALITSSIPFYLYKDAIETGFDVYTDLKWDKRSAQNSDGSNEKRVSAYFDNILFIIRNKVLLNGGSISQTKLTWTYPSSMTDNRVSKLEELWAESFNKYFRNSTKPIKVSESIAPFYYYQRNEGVVANTRSVVGLDIGGGTSDLVVYQDNRPALISSYRFAGDSIFGDGYNNTAKTNGFVLKYLTKAREFLSNNDIVSSAGIQRAITAVEDTSRSGDIISLLFSLEENSKLKDENIHFNFSKLLTSDDTFKAVFFIFYAAQFYHIAKVLKNKGIDSPRYLVLSGTASKTLGFLDSSSDKRNVLKVFNAILSYVSNEFTYNDIVIVHSISPKEITAKGSLLVEEQDASNHESLFYVNTSTGIDSDITYEEAKKTKTIALAEEEYKDFILLIQHLNNTIELDEKFGISSDAMKRVFEILPLDFGDTMLQGINEKMSELNTDGDKKLKETLFFYPLVGRLNKLAYELYTNV
jgi:hypothetical protein